MTNRITHWTFGPLLILVMMSVGCGSSSERPLKLIHVEGTVQLDGKPVDGVSIFFNPLRDTAGVGAYAITDQNGHFKLMHYSKRGKEGCEEGQYAVTFSKVTQPDGTPIPAGKTRAGVATVEQMPKIYTKYDPANATEIAIVKPDSPTLDFNLKSNRRASLAGGAGGRPAGGMPRPVSGPGMPNGRF